jgi:protein tyrosine phosphatase (PTP) superfamily phosphohydrolase (DUF442 family)
VLLAGCYPGDVGADEAHSKLSALIAAGIRFIVNLQEPDELGLGGSTFPAYRPQVEALTHAQGLRITFAQFPITDMNVPPPQLMNTILDTMDESLEQGKPVYVHCRGGHGRTGTVIGCWLVRRGYCPQDALAKITNLRQNDAYLRRQPAPQTTEQIRFVKNSPEHHRLGNHRTNNSEV